ncbi:MAG: inorganic phosphate transporter [Bacteroidales bacterium]|nr:inorganic phosphate transporter [Bacteroidales bacterium]MDD4669596.1 inorganic phosphate transporter [Bacteroidales bacterium]
MDVIYLSIIIFIFLLAIIDLWVGVSNDAVNFLNSALGAKAAPFKHIIVIAAIGVFLGAAMSNGMMDIARHGIFHPQYFYFTDLLSIFFAVMITDVILLDIFNSLGMPTSTTVSLVFELLGGTVALAIFKSISMDGAVPFAEMVNTEKAFSVILGIFVSVPLAFFFGALVQWISRLIFTFNYKKHLKWSIALFGGVAATAIVYFMLIKGVKDLSFMTSDNKLWIHEHTTQIILICFLIFTAVSQLLHILKVSVFKMIVLLGTFALATAFAGNDLVNFIGVPLAGYSSYLDYMANGQGIGADNFLMGSLNGPAKTPIIFLLAAGGVMVISLLKSKKAHNVVKTSLGLSSQEDGNEMFGSSPIARTIVQNSSKFSHFISKSTPSCIKKWIGKRFDKEDAILAEGASFDLVRASVNLVIASLLVALGTSLKLPLSTTYVTFMVAMGSSLADKAWSRESAVFRITGVVSVIGGWFITAGAAFICCFIVTTLFHFTGYWMMIIMAALAVYILIHNNRKYNAKEKAEKEDTLFGKMMKSEDKEQVWQMLKEHIRTTVSEQLSFTGNAYHRITKSFSEENIRSLKRACIAVNTDRDALKRSKKRELLGLQRIDRTKGIAYTTWFHLLSNNTMQLNYCLKRMAEPCKEHLENNFNPLSNECLSEFIPLRDELTELLELSRQMVISNDYQSSGDLIVRIDRFRVNISALRDKHAYRMQRISGSDKLNIFIVYMNMLQESMEIGATLKHLMIAISKFEEPSV